MTYEWHLLLYIEVGSGTLNWNQRKDHNRRGAGEGRWWGVLLDQPKTWGWVLKCSLQKSWGGVEEPFPCLSPKYWTKETGRLRMHLIWEICNKVREKTVLGGVGGVNEKALDEACTSCLCLSLLYFFLYIICMYFSTNRETCEQTLRESRVMHECEGNREKSPNGVLLSHYFLFVTIQRK